MQNARRDCPGLLFEIVRAASGGAALQAETVRPSCGQQSLGRQLLAAVATTTVENCAAVLGCHAGTETVTAGTHELAGLVCTLHNIRPRACTVPLIALPKAEMV